MRAALLLWLLLAAGPAVAEWFAAAGRAQYQPCGGAGCWQQAPLPYEARLHTGTVALGYQSGDWRIALHDLGRVYVHGFFVPDADYDQQAQALRDPGARQFRGIAQMRTQGLSLAWAPQWSHGRAFAGLQAGALIYRQASHYRLDWLDGRCCHTEIAQSAVGITPQLGARIGWQLGRVAIGYQLDAAWRVKQGDAPAGGYGGRPGLVTHLLFIMGQL